MSADTIALWLVTIAAPPQTAFVLLYGLRSPWWRTRTGRAIFTKSLALALLLDLSLVGHWFGPLPDPVSLAVIALVALGAWLQLFALVVEKLQHGTPVHGFDEARRP